MRGRLWVLVGLTLAGCGSCGACGGDAEDEAAIQLDPERGPHVVEMLLSQAPEEGGEPDPFATPAPELGDVIRHLSEVARRDAITGLYLRLGPMGGAWARTKDLVHALDDVREAGKPVHCHLDMADNGTMLLAAAGCDRISVAPAGMVDLVGPAAHVFYARSLLDRIGVRAELVQIGRYKGAADPFTREQMPPETRESLDAILDGLHASLTEALAKHRDMSRERAAEVVDGGPYDAHGARKAGLVDDVAFDDEGREHARRAGEAEEVKRVDLLPKSEPMGLRDIVSALAGERPSEAPEGPRVGLVLIEGTIVDAEREGMSGVRSGPVVRALRRMADDADIAAVVLRIQSPGGSALASDRIWHAVRRVAKRKPVIASVGDLAASGGYYIASAATHLMAHDVSLVGSIGVVGGKVLLTDLAESLGINVVVLERGEQAAWMSPFEPLSDRERQTLERLLRSTYDRFVGRVATGRDMPEARVRAAAEGRLMTGARALELGLVDELGGLDQALARARKEGGLASDAPMQRWPERKTLLDALAQMFGGPEAALRAVTREAGPIGEPLADALALPQLLGHEKVAVTLPFVVRIR
ncbi:MAG: signal peptide peptidase SppA [Myxococcota bacterium]